MGGIVLFICCPIAIIVSIVCCVLCCVVGQSNRQATNKRSRAGDPTQKVPLTSAPGNEALVAGQPQSYPLQPTTASAPPLDEAPGIAIGALTDLEYPAEPEDGQYPHHLLRTLHSLHPLILVPLNLIQLMLMRLSTKKSHCHHSSQHS